MRAFTGDWKSERDFAPRSAPHLPQGGAPSGGAEQRGSVPNPQLIRAGYRVLNLKQRLLSAVPEVVGDFSPDCRPWETPEGRKARLE
jgi:hypothetical protein